MCTCLKKLTSLLMALICLLSLLGCSKANEAVPVDDTAAGTTAEADTPNEVYTFLDKTYGLTFRL